MKIFYFFGDSICFGQYVSIEKTWVHNVAKFLNNKTNNKYIFLNSSIIGNTTRDALNRFQNEILLRYPSIIYAQFGMNDCNIWETEFGLERVSIRLFEANLNELIWRSLPHNVIFLLGTNHLSNKTFGYNKRNKQYNEIIRKVANDNNIFLIDHEQHWRELNIKDFLLEDGIHLNENGHNEYYNFFINQIENKL